VAVAACVGAILGDNVGYLIGRRFGRGFVERHGRRLLITPERLERADEYYRSHGGKTVFLGRFIPFVRSIGFILAGVAHMRWRRFLLYDVAGSVVWGIGNTVLGYVIGASYERWKGYLTPVGLAVLVLLLAFILWTRWRGRRREARREAAERREDGQATVADATEELKVNGRPADD
jgi:membrane protein DedA with SNARE-associated domain